MIDTHNLKMSGLKNAAGYTKGLSGYYSGEYVELFYDRYLGKIWTRYQYSLGQNTWTQYHDAGIIKIGNLSEPTTMQQIADMIAERVREVELVE